MVRIILILAGRKYYGEEILFRIIKEIEKIRG